MTSGSEGTRPPVENTGEKFASDVVSPTCLVAPRIE